jgi:hypothetical protein
MTDWLQIRLNIQRLILPVCRHRSEQYLTSSQTRSHFLRQANGRPQVTQVLCGRLAFLCMDQLRPGRCAGSGGQERGPQASLWPSTSSRGQMRRVTPTG